MKVAAAVMAAVWRVMWLPVDAFTGPLSLPTVKAKTAVKARSAAVMMQPSTIAAMRRRLNRAVCGKSTGWNGASGTSTTAETGWAASRRPLGREGFDGGSGGDLGGFDLEDTELGSLGTLVGGLIGFFAERAFGQAGTGLAGGYELAGKLDEVGGNVDGRADVFEGGGLAEGDLVLEGEGFGFIERVLSLSLVPATGGGGLRIAAGYLVCVVEPDCEARGGILLDGRRG